MTDWSHMGTETFIPDGYKSLLTLRETQQAIKYIKDVFQQTLASFLVLDREIGRAHV